VVSDSVVFLLLLGEVSGAVEVSTGLVDFFDDFGVVSKPVVSASVVFLLLFGDVSGAVEVSTGVVSVVLLELCSGVELDSKNHFDYSTDYLCLIL